MLVCCLNHAHRSAGMVGESLKFSSVFTWDQIKIPESLLLSCARKEQKKCTEKEQQVMSMKRPHYC